jgi:hypothetical protein
MRFNEITISEELDVAARYATRAETQALAKNLQEQLPDYRFAVEKKNISPVFYIRIFGAEKQAIKQYFQSHGLDSLPIEPEQAAISGKYRNNILSFETSATPISANKPPQGNDTADNVVNTVIYTLVVASSGAKTDETGVSVSIKEFTPTTLGLAGKIYTKDELISATQQAVLAKTKTRPELMQILLGLVNVAASGGNTTLDPEVNRHLTDRARNQLSVDFGEILAPIMFAKGNQSIEFPAEGNFPLVDVIVGSTKFSVKSLTGSGTSFRSISDLMDNFEKTIKKDSTQEKLFALFKAYHPNAGGKNVDKLVKAANFVKIPEYKKAVEILGGEFDNWTSLQNLVKSLVKGNSATDYGDFLKAIYPIMVAGPWGRPVGLPADGQFYMGMKKDKAAEKEAGYPSFKANPVKAATDILTYALGVGTLNAVTKGPDAEEYAKMMTNVVNQSSAYLGRLDITDEGGVVASAKPFTDLKFKFQYHAPSHMPGNNLPGFMIVY